MYSNKWRFPSVLVLAAAIAFSAPALWSQGVEQVQGSCTMDGTWYGGGPLTKYLLTIIANPGGDYTMTGYAAFTQATLGIPVTTTFSNSIVKVGRRAWEFFGIGMINKSAGFPAPTPEVWALHGTARLKDCNTLQLDYDFFGAYLLPTEKKPFISPPDHVIVPPPFSETYERMPTTCTQCSK
jgi:hypothetical protein